MIVGIFWWFGFGKYFSFLFSSLNILIPLTSFFLDDTVLLCASKIIGDKILNSQIREINFPSKQIYLRGTRPACMGSTDVCKQVTHGTRKRSFNVNGSGAEERAAAVVHPPCHFDALLFFHVKVSVSGWFRALIIFHSSFNITESPFLLPSLAGCWRARISLNRDVTDSQRDRKAAQTGWLAGWLATTFFLARQVRCSLRTGPDLE